MLIAPLNLNSSAIDAGIAKLFVNMKEFGFTLKKLNKITENLEQRVPGFV